jgi:hypothetical protein
MQQALAAARAEIEASKSEPAPQQPTERQDIVPLPEEDTATRENNGDPTTASQAADAEPPAQTNDTPRDLDPETATKLKLLRRLNPHKSVDELLAQIASDSTTGSGQRQRQRRKRFWGK